jgi:methylglutaconyl-CoA hydratase
LDDAVGAVVKELLAGGPDAQAATKQLLRQIPNLSRDEAFAVAAKVSAQRFNSDEAREGIDAFKAKRPPSWG